MTGPILLIVYNQMQGKSKKNIHIGINFLLAPSPVYDKESSLRFQSQLESEKIEISNVSYVNNQISIVRQTPTNSLDIKLINVAPQVTQFVVLIGQPEYSFEIIEEEIDRIFKVYNNIWPTFGRQLLASDVTIRSLFDSSSSHAFQEIWVNRLKQDPLDLSLLGRPIQGGGLRLVMPPVNQLDPNDFFVDLKIESFFQDPSKIFVEALFNWKIAVTLTENIIASEKLKKVEDFLNKNVVDFIQVD